MNCSESLDDPDKVLLLERWTNQEVLDRDIEAERTRNTAPIDAVMALRVLGTTPTIERFEMEPATFVACEDLRLRQANNMRSHSTAARARVAPCLKRGQQPRDWRSC